MRAEGTHLDREDGVFKRATVVVGLAALFGAALASSSAGQGPPPGAGPPGGPPGLDKAIAAKEKHAKEMLDKPGVVGIGVGVNPAGKPVIHVYKDETTWQTSPTSSTMSRSSRWTRG